MPSKALNLAKFFRPTEDGKIDPLLVDFTGSGASPGIVSVENISNLGSGTEGQSAFVTSTKSLYLHDGTKWNRVSSGINSAPIFKTNQPPDTLSLTIDGSPTTLNATAVDPEYDSAVFPIEYSWEITDSSGVHTNTSGTFPAQITNISGFEYTGDYVITPSTNVSDYGTLTFKAIASDGSASTTKNVTITLDNTAPAAITGVNDNYSLSTSGVDTVITAISSDIDGEALSWSYTLISGSLNGCTISQSPSMNVFTITPHLTNAANFVLRISVTDGTSTTTKDVTFALTRSVSARLLIVGGGGGGGQYYNRGSYSWRNYGGGGGGGMVLRGTTDLVTGQAFSVTVGDGGSYGSNGNNSSLDSFIAYKGGRGGGYPNVAAGGSGYGSGGGGAGIESHEDRLNNLDYNSGGSAGTSSLAWLSSTPAYEGGDGGFYNSYQQRGLGGGGGGAGQNGSNGTNSSSYVSGYGGPGGNGRADDITGTSTYYGGGGGGGVGVSKVYDPTDPNFIYSYRAACGPGGLGGGGNGSGSGGGWSAHSSRNGTNGLGGGGGGGAGQGSYGGSQQGGPGGSGGRGVVIVRVASSISVTTTGSVTTTTVGSDKVYKFTSGSGTIQFE